MCAAALLLAPAVSVAAPSGDDALHTASAEPAPDAPRDQAPRITVGSHTGVADSIDPAGEVDWFYFEAPRAGTYTVEVFNVATSIELRGSVYSGDTRLTNDGAGDGAVHRRISVPVSIPGTYHVRVAGRYSSDRGTYRVRVLPQYDQGLTWASNGEPDGALVLAPEVRVGREHAVNRAIEPVPAGTRRTGADVDWIRFTAPRAGVYTIEAFDSSLQLSMSARDRTGNTVGSSLVGSGVVDRYVEIPVSLPGEYFVRTTARYTDDTGTYKLRVLPQYDQGHTWTSAFEPNNTWMTGYSGLDLGFRLHSTIETRRTNTRDRADEDWFNTTMSAGTEHVVEVAPTGFQATVQLYDSSGSRISSANCAAGRTCTYSLTPAIAGTHHVRIVPRYTADSGTYTVCARRAGGTCSSLDPSKVTRLGGNDRYATAARVASQFPANVELAFVADGNNFPDALAGAARAGSVDAPVLLTRAGSLPGATANELARLRPNRIIVLGGRTAINDTVLQQLRQYARSTGSNAVTRLAGEDRFDTSARISALYPSGVPTAYVATGRAFPDALAGAALAGTGDAPLLLVDRSRIPSSVQRELARLRPQRIVILGGTSAVDGTVARALEAYATAPTGKVSRIAGDDRYLTSAAVAARFPAGVQGAYLATGRSFPDALAGAALAGSRHSPVLLTGPSSLSSAIRPQLERLRPGHGYVIGSTGVITDTVAQQLSSYIR